MPLKLLNIEKQAARIVAHYEAYHSTPGREGTRLDQPLDLVFQDGKWTCDVHMKDCTADTADEALDRMSAWLRRMADGIDKRMPSVPVPLLDGFIYKEEEA